LDSGYFKKSGPQFQLAENLDLGSKSCSQNQTLFDEILSNFINRKHPRMGTGEKKKQRAWTKVQAGKKESQRGGATPR
jgi:hypothetical protein